MKQRTQPCTQSPSVYHQRFRVSFDYPVHFTRDAFDLENRLFLDVLDRRQEGRRQRVYVCIDAGVAETHPGLIRQIKDYCHEHHEHVELVASPEIVPGGEPAKNSTQVVTDIMFALGNHHMCRQSHVVAIGGGAMLDMVGFAVSLVHRGLRLVRMPTTVLAQNDAGVGVKNGMNEHGVKNFIGTFAPPFAVINDFAFLPTLPEAHWRGGIAEAFKVAIIKDREFLDVLCRDAAALRLRKQGPMEELIRRCAILHLDHIAANGDPFEMGTARPLDFGHWSAHKIETVSHYNISHGEAVALGIALDSYYARKKGLICGSDLVRILGGLTGCGLEIWQPVMGQRNADGELVILAGLREFQEHLGGTLTITLPDSIGNKCEVHHMNADLIEEGVLFLQDFAVKCEGRTA